MNKTRYAVLANLLVPLAGMSIDIYLPSLPHMAQAFSTDDSFVQLTMTSFVIAMGLGQYLAGPVSDAIGRKSLIVTSLVIQFITVVTIIHVPIVSLIIATRALQGIACAFMIVPARALLNDNFEGNELKKKFNYLTISFALAPIVAPFIGGYCEYYFGWQASFYFLLAYIIILLILMLCFTTETIKIKRQFSMRHLIHNYKIIMASKSYMFRTLFLSVLFGYTALSSILGPFIFQNTLGLSAVEYGYVALSLGLAWFLGNLTNRILFNVEHNIKVISSLFVQSMMIVILAAFSYFEVITVASFLVPLFIIIFCAAIMFAMFVSESLSQFPDLAASSNAFLFATTWLAFGAYTYYATFLPVNKVMPIALTYLFVNCICYLLMKKIRSQ
ncbi:Multidrug resistance protein D [Aquicella siphonis]|uniref:Multidrug resistance protein D n=1 Tax=Aquicella siphonis TaxID=254247 RepID=A0A5E4PEF9_9COXI|nr:MFS transporter [Aquicella siphonis]VVC75369.1 Multidrug resistance protein D [Aquicella siphonis]